MTDKPDIIERLRSRAEAPNAWTRDDYFLLEVADEIERLREDSADDIQANDALRGQRNQLLSALSRLLNVTQTHCMKLPVSYESHAAWEDAKQLVWEIEHD